MIFCRIDTCGDGVFIGEGITYETAYADAKNIADEVVSLDGSESITFWKANKVNVQINRSITFIPID